MIPEESAKKFKSLYTDRIRLVNIVLTSLFLAALGLLAIDIRLIANQYWQCFRFKISSAAAAASSKSSTTKSMVNTSDLLGNEKLAASAAMANQLTGKRLFKNGGVGGLTGQQVANSTSKNIAYEGYAATQRALGGLSSPLLPDSGYGSQTTTGREMQQQQQQQQDNKSVQVAVRYNGSLPHSNGANYEVVNKLNATSRSTGLPIVEVSGQPQAVEALKQSYNNGNNHSSDN